MTAGFPPCPHFPRPSGKNGPARSAARHAQKTPAQWHPRHPQLKQAHRCPPRWSWTFSDAPAPFLHSGSYPAERRLPQTASPPRLFSSPPAAGAEFLPSCRSENRRLPEFFYGTPPGKSTPDREPGTDGYGNKDRGGFSPVPPAACGCSFGSGTASGPAQSSPSPHPHPDRGRNRAIYPFSFCARIILWGKFPEQ